CDQQDSRASAEEHRELQDRPGNAHGQQDPAGGYLSGQEADNNADNGEEEEEGAADEAELTGSQPEFAHGGISHEPQDSFVGEVHDLEEYQHAGHHPGAPVHFAVGNGRTQGVVREILCRTHTKLPLESAAESSSAAGPMLKTSLSSAMDTFPAKSP